MNIVYATGTRQLANGVSIYKGQHWPANDPIVQENPGLFSDDPRFGLTYSPGHAPREMAYAPGEPIPDDDIPVEQVTAGPGERRNVRRPVQR
jgi:hypothetical protein